MRNAIRWWLALASACALYLCAPGVARAEPPAQPFRLEYWAHGKCPDADEFSLQLRARAPALRPAVDGEPAVAFYAELAEGNGSAYGRLTTRSLDGREITRDVGGPTCDDVVTALALIAALSLEPDDAQPPVAKRARALPHRDHARARARDEEPEELLDQPRRVTGARYGVGVGAAFESAVAPSPSTGVFFAFEAEAAPQLVQPFFALSANRVTSDAPAGPRLNLTWLSVRAAGCPLRWPEDVPLFLRPCAFFEVGTREAKINSATVSSSQNKFWSSLGASARIEALVGDALAFSLDGGFSFPLTRDSFAEYHTPPNGVTGRLGISYRFK